MFVFALCSQMSVYSDAIIVSLILGVDPVVPFTLTQRLLHLADARSWPSGPSREPPSPKCTTAGTRTG